MSKNIFWSFVSVFISLFIVSSVFVQKYDYKVCKHDWILGPYYILAARAMNLEPILATPSLFVNIEHCQKCGVLRLDDSRTDKYKTGRSIPGK